MSDVDTGTERLIGRRDGAIGWMLFNNPARRNALSIDMWAGIPKVLNAFDADPSIRVIVYKGEGDKAFVSGADISQFEDLRADKAGNESYGAVSGAANRAMATVAKPTIAMIRGFCIGGGLATALTTDLRICSEDSRFGIPAARLGLGYAFEGTRGLVDLVGPAYAREIMFTARQFTAEEALRMGLVNKVVPVAELESTVRNYAEMIGANAPLTVRASKLTIREALKDPERRKMHEVNAAVNACFESDDYKEGRRAFMEKRKADFKGK